jgi:hypothetical protein
MMISLSCGAETVLVCLFHRRHVPSREMGGVRQVPFGWLQRLVLGAGEKNIGHSFGRRRRNLPGA